MKVQCRDGARSANRTRDTPSRCPASFGAAMEGGMTTASCVKIRIVGSRLAQAVSWLEQKLQPAPSLIDDIQLRPRRSADQAIIIAQLRKASNRRQQQRYIEIDCDLARILVLWLDPYLTWTRRPPSITFLQRQLRRELARKPGRNARVATGGGSPRQLQRHRRWQREIEAEEAERKHWLESLPKLMIDHPILGQMEVTSILADRDVQKTPE